MVIKQKLPLKMVITRSLIAGSNRCFMSPTFKSGIFLSAGVCIFGFADNLMLFISEQVSVGQFHFHRSIIASLAVLLIAYFISVLWEIIILNKIGLDYQIQFFNLVLILGIYLSLEEKYNFFILEKNDKFSLFSVVIFVITIIGGSYINDIKDNFFRLFGTVYSSAAECDQYIGYYWRVKNKSLDFKND